MTLHLELELSELNQVLEALGQKPYAEVFALIEKLRQQAASQLTANRSQGDVEDE